MNDYWRDPATATQGVAATMAAASTVTAPFAAALAQSADSRGKPTPLIKYVIVVTGEPDTFDDAVVVYVSKGVPAVHNLALKVVAALSGDDAGMVGPSQAKVAELILKKARGRGVAVAAHDAGNLVRSEYTTGSFDNKAHGARLLSILD
jgi:hypothetical protein